MHDLETTVTQKGQVTIPQELRVLLGLKPRDRVRFAVEGETITLRKATSAILAGYGSVEPRQRPEDFAAVRREVEAAIGTEVAAETHPKP
jgi:antitoxin PrlF